MRTARVLKCLSRGSVTRRRLPPRLFGYRYLRQREPSDFDCQLIDGPEISRVPLPGNITTRDQLPGDTSHWPFSFRDVPERRVSETFFATIPNCRVLVGRDRWGDGYYAIVTGRDEAVRVRC